MGVTNTTANPSDALLRIPSRASNEGATMRTSLPVSALVLLLSCPGPCHPLFLDMDTLLHRRNSSLGRGNHSVSGGWSQDAIMGLFDAVSGLTHGIGDAIQQFDPSIANKNSSVSTNETSLDILERKDLIADDEGSDSDSSLGSTVVVGLFDSLRQFTKQLGKLVNKVGDRLDDRREDVVRIAGEVDTQVSDLGDNIQEWKRKTFGGFRRGGDQEDDESEEQSSTDDIDADILISENDTTIFDDTQEATTTIIEVEAEEDEDRKESDLPLKNETNLV